jgi:hypothetical protein
MNRRTPTLLPDGQTTPAAPAAPVEAPTERAESTATAVPTVRELARRVRTSALLTPALRRYWLEVLPHLQPVDRLRLDAILRRVTPAG